MKVCDFCKSENCSDGLAFSKNDERFDLCTSCYSGARALLSHKRMQFDYLPKMPRGDLLKAMRSVVGPISDPNKITMDELRSFYVTNCIWLEHPHKSLSKGNTAAKDSSKGKE